MIVNRYLLLDFDRTLADTTKLKATFDQIAESLGYYNADYIKKQLSLDRRFDTYEFLRQTYGDAKSQMIITELEAIFEQHQPKSDFLLPDTTELLKWLEAQQYPFGIMTYGEKRWQLAKIRASGLISLPHLITDHKYKGRKITTWRDDSGNYQLPPELGGRVVQHLALLDDELYSFDGMPSDVKKFYYVKSPDLATDRLDLIQLKRVSELQTHLLS